jgi:hypothetical protein
MRVRGWLAAVAGLAAFGFGPSAIAAGGSTIHLSPSTVVRGHYVRVYGAVPGCPRGDELSLLSGAFVHTHDFAGVPAVNVTVGRGGAYSVRTRIPASKALGRYSVSGRCGGGNIGTFATLRVVR